MKRFAVAMCVAVSMVMPATLWADTTQPATGAAEAPVARKSRVAVIKLSGEVLERPASFSFSLLGGLSDSNAPALSDLITTLGKAARDPALSGVVLDLSALQLSMTHANEIGQLLKQVRSTGKRVTVYASDFDTTTYVLASNADSVVMPENGNLFLPGVSLQLMFFKGTLDKLDMSADFVQVGKFKGAEEPFTRTSSSPEFKQQIDGLLDGMYANLVATISQNRPNLEEADVKKLIDQAWMTGKRAKAAGLVDHNLTREKLDAWLDGQFEHGATLIADYGKPKKSEMEGPFALLQLFGGGSAPVKRSTTPTVAVLYATGQIMPDVLDSQLSDAIVTPRQIRQALEKALRDEMVKSIVLRVDSPGGSASASDEIWEVIKQADKKKPVTVSLGRVAASGGYYIACAGRTITADPATISGSIGVVGGKIVMKGLTDKLGIGVETHSRGKHAEIFSVMRPFTEEERTFIRKSMEETYETFSNRVIAARGKKIVIDEVAQGRLYTGEAAVKAGLVDKLGSLSDVVAAAAKDAGIEKSYNIMVLPEPKTLADYLRDGLGMELSAPTLQSGVVLQALPSEFRSEAARAMRLAEALKRERVLMALPVSISESK